MKRSSNLTWVNVLLLAFVALLLCHSPSYADFTDTGAALINVGMSAFAWGDYDNDGDLDIVIAGTTAKSPNYNPFSKICRNDGNGTFTDIGANLVAVFNCSLAWGDYDNDGDLDLALAGACLSPPYSTTSVTKIYRNDSGTFVDIAANIPRAAICTLAWGDYDNDGDLDLALAKDRTGTIIYRNDNGTFTADPYAIPGGFLKPASGSACAWGDYDNDGDLDLVIAGLTYNLSPTSGIYRNDNGVFTNINAGLVTMSYASLAWGDYDNDGDLDLALAGYTGMMYISKIYRNDNGIFADIGAAFPTVSAGSVSWGDCDNDGDLDLAATEFTGSAYASKIYGNDNGVFTDSGYSLTGLIGSAVWGDFDGDGDLDIALTGSYYDAATGDNFITRIYRNNSLTANSPPTPPTGLTSSIADSTVTLSWNAALDAQTPAAGLSYNIRVGTAPGKDDIFCGMANPSTGLRRLPAIGNAQKKLSWTLRNSKPSPCYYWSVQAIDSTYTASAWATEVVSREDEVPPVVNSVAAIPSMVAAGDRVHIAVDVTDNKFVASVTADGSALARTGAATWEGEISAAPAIGIHPVTVVAVDAAANSTTDTSASYKTAPVVGSMCANAIADVMINAQFNYLFRFWGRVNIIDSTSFWLYDGSHTTLKIIAPGYAGIADNDYAAARGILDPGTTSPTLTCPAETVKKLQ